MSLTTEANPRPPAPGPNELERDLLAAEAGDVLAMIRLARRYEPSIANPTAMNGHRALSYWVAAFRRNPALVSEHMPRVVTDMETLFNTPASSVETPPWEDPPASAVSEASARTIALYQELRHFALVPRLFRPLAFECATGRRTGLRVPPLTAAGDWRTAIRLAADDPAAAAAARAAA